MPYKTTPASLICENKLVLTKIDCESYSQWGQGLELSFHLLMDGLGLKALQI